MKYCFKYILSQIMKLVMLFRKVDKMDYLLTENDQVVLTENDQKLVK